MNSTQQTANPGFRHFLDDPAPREQFNGGEVRLSPPALNKALGKLAQRMAVSINDERHDPAATAPQRWENPRIPSGYTYLAQFIGHDLVYSSVSLMPLNNPVERRNLRTVGLNLDTMYGGGPDDRAVGYWTPHGRNRIKTYLRLGSVREHPSAQHCPMTFRDLPRTTAARAETPTGSHGAGPTTLADLTALTSDPAVVPYGLPDVLIADSRNDGNAILAQLTVLFHLFHNIVMHNIDAATVDPSAEAHSVKVRDLINFHKARSIVVATYRQIVRDDFLKKIMHPDVYAYYSEGGSTLDKAELGKIPIEFSHAAFRFGHTMVRQGYTINKKHNNAQSLERIVMFSSSLSPQRFPLPSNWLVEWSQFFDLGAVPLIKAPPINLSRKIGPHMASSMNRNDFIDMASQDDANDHPGLPYRDLVRGARSGLWSVSALIEKIKHGSPQLALLIDENELLTDASVRREAIAAWLMERKDIRFDPDALALLSHDPPLGFFVLFEAENQHPAPGEHLGLLGSIIVGDVIFSLLRNPPQHSAEDTGRFGIPSLSSMSELICFIDKHLSEEDRRFPLI